jgi:hypothetical protein
MLSVSIAFLILLSFLPVQSQTGPDFEFVKRVQARHQEALFVISGVNAVGIGWDDRRYTFHVFVNEEDNPNPEQSVPKAVEGVRVVVIRMQGEFVALVDDGPEHRQPFPPPVPMGVSTSNEFVTLCAFGTLGFRARDPITGQVGYITNNHVAAAGELGCPNNAPIGTNQFQPGLGDNLCRRETDIGDLDRFVPIDFGTNTNNRVDAAFVASSTALVSNSILDIGPPVGPARDPILNEFAQKSGRTTGLTTGQVRVVNLTARVRYGAFSQCVARFVGQVVIDDLIFGRSFVKSGDSGSPVLTLDGEPIGLIFAGGTLSKDLTDVGVANPLPVVLQDLGVELF